MKNRIVFAVTTLVIAAELMAFSIVERTPAPASGNLVGMAVQLDGDSYNDCIEKFNSEWGSKIGKCAEYEGYKASYEDTYRIDLRNTCDETLDVMIAVKEEDGTWNCKTVTSVAPKTEISHYACKGVGKYIWWTRKAGDGSVAFPTNEQVNEEYKD